MLSGLIEHFGAACRAAIRTSTARLRARFGPIQCLVLYGGVLITAIAIGTVLAAQHFRDRAINNTERQLENTVLLVTRHFEEKFGDLQGIQNEVVASLQAARMASNASWRARIASDRTHQMLRAKLDALPQGGAFNVFDSEGMLLNSSRLWPAGRENVGDRGFFKAFKSGTNDAKTVVEPVVSRVTGTWTVLFAQKLAGPDGEFLGVVTRTVEPSQFEMFFASLELGPDATISMFHRDGTMLARYPRDEKLIGRNLSQKPVFRLLLQSGGHYTGRFKSPIDGLDRLRSARQLATFPILIVGTTTMSAALADWRGLTKLLIIVAALSALVIGVILFLIVRELSCQHRSARQLLSQKSQHLDTAIDNMTQGLLLFDAEGRLILRNQRYLDMFGLPADAVQPGCHLRDLLARRKENGTFIGDIDEYCANFLREAAEGTVRDAVLAIPDGRSIQIVYKNSSDGGFATTLEDVTERQRSEARITRLAHYDALTGLPNRVLFREQVESSLAAIDATSGFAIHYIDVDQFKEINDSLGHQVGDEFLKVIANRLQSSLASNDFVARLGGDEFAIIQMDVESRDDVIRLLDRIYRAIREPYECLGHQIASDLSIGIALAPADGASLDQLLKHADLAMYAAKADGRRTWRFFERGMEEGADARRAIESDLRRALATRQDLEVYYQPVVDLNSREVTACEALVRWHHAERGMIAPTEFIPVAEHTGLITELGEWVLATACAEAATWPDQVRLAVNVSPVQFKSGTFALRVTAALAASGLPANRLEIEITEAVLIRDDDVALAILHQLRAIGVRIALDDFGTGYSSLSYLQRFPFDRIKIDRTFVREITSDGSSSIVKAVVDIAAARHMITTAEGIETQEQFDILRALGCTEMQGFLFSPARPACEIRAMFGGRSWTSSAA
jgi:diguanylate cyclase (GGDEF)-like protein